MKNTFLSSRHVTRLRDGTSVPLYETEHVIDDVISDVISAVHANDSDSGGNARVSYELLNENVHFIIGERSGVIRLRENHPFGQVGLGSVRFIYIDIDMNN